MRHNRQRIWRYRREAWQGLCAGLRALLWLLLPVLPLLILALAPLLAVITFGLWRRPDSMIGWMVFYCSGVAAMAPLGRLCQRLAWLGGGLQMPPEMVEIHRTQAPALFVNLDAVCHACNNVKIDGVFISAESNASMVRLESSAEHRHRRNVMVLGMPLLATLTLPQLRAVMAHECGHRGGIRNRLNYIVNILDRVLSRAGEEIIQRVYGHQLQRWLAWCGQLCRPSAFTARLRLSRSCEYRADRMAARVCSEIGAAQTLSRLVLVERTHEEFLWRSTMAVAGKQVQPGDMPFCKLLAESAKCREEEQARCWLDQKWLDIHGDESTHPDFRSRLQMLGYNPDDAYVPANGADSALAGLIPPPLAKKIAAALDQIWLASAAEAGSTLTTALAAQRRERDLLRCRMNTQSMSARDMYRLAVLLRGLDDEQWRSTLYLAIQVPSEAPVEALLMAAADDLDRGALDAAAAMIAHCRRYFPAAGFEYSRLKLRLARLQGDSLAEVAGLRRVAVEDARQQHALHVEWSRVAPDAHYAHFDMSSAGIGALQRQLQRMRAAARSVYLLKQISTVHPECWRWVIVVIVDADWQEELLDRLRLSPSRQRERCLALFEPLASIDGTGCTATIQMPGSRLAGRIARGKAFHRML